MNKKSSKKPSKTLKKAKKRQKKDLNNIPEVWPNGVKIPLYIREMMASGQISYSDIQLKAMEAMKPPAQLADEPPKAAPVVEKTMESGEELSDSEMSSLLKEFYNSRVWKAYKIYINRRLQLVTDAMFSTDPYKDTTKMAQQQGIRLGLIDVEGYIVSLLNLERKNLEENQP